MRQALLVLFLLALTGCVDSVEPGPNDPLTGELPAGLETEVVSALEAARSQAAESSRSGETLGELARIYHANKLFEFARTTYRAAERADPEFAEWPHLAGSATPIRVSIVPQCQPAQLAGTQLAVTVIVEKC